jgi:DNA gyrase subunit A
MTTTNGTTPSEIHTNGANGATPPENIGLVRATDIVGEMQVAYLDYAMSVIVARALPDVRDGLKPVHRRILYAMYADLGLTHDKPHKKSARVVGEVLGKYHPHGDVAVYDAMARMAQDFSLRYCLVDGQGNFGSIDGDSPAAMRYTEARLAEISNLLLDDIEKETVAWGNNFDNTLLEPTVLPAALPNLLINGSSGIAVGMATNIPPHNLGEVVDALAYLIDHYATVDEITVEQLMGFVQGPDFPTGGMIYRYREEQKSEEQVDAIAQGYSVGKSRLVLQAKAHFEEISRGRHRIVITELPYQTNKSALIERIADLVRDGKLEGIADLRDESDRTGMRVIIELSRNIDPKTVLADLFKYTPLQQTFGMQMLALVDGQPRMLSLKRMLHLFIQHRQEIVRRRSEFDLARARERAHIVEGLLKALDMLDEVIQTIRRSQTVETARNNLIKNFKFTPIQAQAILDMQLRRLAALERRKLQDEFQELTTLIAHLEDLLAHPEKILALIKGELLAIKEKYGDARRTQIVERTKGTLTTTDLIPQQDVWVSLGRDGHIRRQDVGKLTNTVLRQLSKGGDAAIVTTNTRDMLYLFSQDGRCGKIPVHEILPDGSKHCSELSRFSRSDKLTTALTFANGEPIGERAGYLFLVTVQGVVKRVALADVLEIGPGVTTVMSVEAKDRLGWVFATQGDQEVILVANSGQAIRFREDEVRSMGLPAGGVGGMKLKKAESIVYANVVDSVGELITLSELGFAKRSPLLDYPSQGRNGGGIVTHKTTERTGQVATALLVGQGPTDDGLLILTRKGMVRPTFLSEIPVMGRSVQGKMVMEPPQGDRVVLLQRVVALGKPPASTQPSEPTTAYATSPPNTAEAKPAATDKRERSAATKPAPSSRAPTTLKVEVRPANGTGQTTVVPANQPSTAKPTNKPGPAPARAKSTNGKGEEASVQAALFAGEPVKEPTTPPAPKAQKLQAVVSVPAGQGKRNK